MEEDYDVVHLNDSPVTSNWTTKQKVEGEEEGEEGRETSIQDMLIEMIVVRLDRFPAEDKFIGALKSILQDTKRTSKCFRKRFEIACAIDSVLGGSLLQQEYEMRHMR